MFETWLESDLHEPVYVKQLKGNLFTADNNGNLIGVILTDHGEPVTLTGGVVGYVIRADGKTVIVNGGTSDNKAYIILPASAYVIDGQVSIVVKVGTTTVGAVIAYIYKSTTDDIIDPGHEIPSIEELLAKIADCEAATTNANAAAANATNKANLAEEKATLANTAANTATEKASLADEKATLANTAAVNANTKANLADEKAALANTAAGSANTATTEAYTAAGKIENMTVNINAGDPTLPPTATLTLVDGHYVLTFNNMKGATGATGDAFHVVKTYASVAAMEADYSGTDTHIGDYVMVVNTVEDPDNAKVYIKGNSAWQFIVDMSGTTGIKGDTGNGIASAVLNSDYTLTLTFTDGTSYTTPSIRGERGLTGATGNGIAGTVLNSDYTLTITFTDGTSYTTPSIRGETGATGQTGDTGNGISGIVMNADYTITIYMTNGTSYTTPPVRGEKGDTGATGTTGPTGPGATVLTQETEWQNSQSGTTVPTGTWQSSVPSTPQGWYLWTRVTIHWSDGTDTVSYSVSRMGVDGEGNLEFSGYQNEMLEFSLY